MQVEKLHVEQIISENADAIRERIAARMGSAHGTQVRVSRETGIGTGHLSQLLSGKRPLKLRYLRLLAGALQVNFDWLLTGTGHPDDVDTPAAPGVSRGHADSGALSIDQVGKLLAAAERERLTPDQRALLAEYDALPAPQRDLFWRLLRSALAEPAAPQPEALNENTTTERGRGKG